MLFLSDKRSVNNLNVISMFSSFSRLKSNLSKCEFAGIESLRRVKKVICVLKCIDLTKEVVKILGIFYSYDKKIELEKNSKMSYLTLTTF